MMDKDVVKEKLYKMLVNHKANIDSMDNILAYCPLTCNIYYYDIKYKNIGYCFFICGESYINDNLFIFSEQSDKYDNDFIFKGHHYDERVDIIHMCTSNINELYVLYYRKETPSLYLKVITDIKEYNSIFIPNYTNSNLRLIENL